MGKSDNLDGKRFGKLEVVELSHKRGNRRYWKCKCDCGNTVIRDAQSLIYGGSKSCGCNKNRLQDLTGQRFGRLTVIERAENKGTKTRWLCLCDCGNKVVKVGSDLRSGDTQSCGCFRSEKTSERSLKDLTGKKFGMLTVLKRAENVGKNTMWLCKCDCGKETTTSGGRLVSGVTRSCGCLKFVGYNWKHEGANTRIYNIWSSMKQRCINPNSHAYKWYGERGISICTEWLGEHGFENFREWSLSNGYEENLTIDRIDNNGNYEPSNCRWVDMKTQENNKRGNRIIEYKGESHTITEWSEITGIKIGTISSRLKRGWSYEDCIEKLVEKNKPNNDKIKSD